MAIEKTYQLTGISAGYTTGTEFITVTIGTRETQISNVLNRGQKMKFYYAIKNLCSDWVIFDIRRIENFKSPTKLNMLRNGIKAVATDIAVNQNNYKYLLQ